MNRDSGLGVRASGDTSAQALAKAAEHSSELVTRLQERLGLSCGKEPEPSAYNELCLHLGQRAMRNKQMPEIIAERPGVALCDVGRHRHGSAPELRDEAVALPGGEPFSGAICRLDKVPWPAARP